MHPRVRHQRRSHVVPLSLVYVAGSAYFKGFRRLFIGLAVFLQRSVVQLFEAVAKIVHRKLRVYRNAPVDGDAELDSARIAENTHADANVAALGYPEHGLLEPGAGQIHCRFRAGYVGQYRGGFALNIDSARRSQVRPGRGRTGREGYRLSAPDKSA